MSQQSETKKELLPTQEEVLMNEDELLNGLLEAAKFKEDKRLRRLIKIRRNGKLFFEFTIRPLTEEEVQQCRKKVTKRRPDPRGKQFGMIEIEIDRVKLHSHKILMATVDTGNGIIWSNKKVKEKIGVLSDVDVIDEILLYGEKSNINDTIDEISGFHEDVTEEDMAKN